MIASTQTNHPLAAYSQEKQVSNPQQARELICSRLKAAGLRSTQPRISIFNALTELKEPAPIEQIFRSIKNNSCDLVTVYRGLALFEELGLVQRSFSNNGTGLYELKREGAPSFFVSCKTTGRREVLDAEMASELQKTLQAVEAHLASRGYRKLSLRVDINGISPDPNTREAAVVDASGVRAPSRTESPLHFAQ
jgi:Fur family transcriptional regulator, ferric uptake regulator